MPTTIKLRSSDGDIFPLDISVSKQCLTLRDMLENLTGDESDDSDIDLPNIDSIVLKMIIDWLKENHDAVEPVIHPPEKITDLFPIIVAASYLNIQNLLQLCCKAIADQIRGKKMSEIQALFQDECTKKPRLGKILLFEADPYEGKDPNLQHRNRCYNMECEEEEMWDYEVRENENEITVLKCSRCHLTTYCSKKCQKQAWSEHKEFCNSIRKQTQLVEKLAKPLRNYKGYEGYKNLFETSVGHFWGLVDPRDYCCARGELARDILHFAHNEDHISIYEVGLAHHLELLRLSHGDNQGIRNHTPFVLLKMNRDDDAYSFIKWWETIDPNGRYDWGKPPPSHEGQWLYLKKQDRYEDIFEVVPNAKEKSFELSFLVAILVIKLRILAKHHQRLSEYRELLPLLKDAYPGSTVLTDNLPLIHEQLVGDKAHGDLMEKQERLVTKYLTIVSNNNKIFLPAVLNPGPLKSQPYPCYYSRGSAEEAFLVLNDSCRDFHRIPGAIKRITAFLGQGKSPAYDPSYDKF